MLGGLKRVVSVMCSEMMKKQRGEEERELGVSAEVYLSWMDSW